MLLPVRNASGTLTEALSSLGQQTFGDWECLVLDDGSSDDSLAVARGLALAEPRLRVLALPASGIVAALNLGLGESRGSYVARMDADDLMHPERLAEQCALLDASPELAGAGCHVRLFPRAPLSPKRVAYEAWLCSLRSPHDVFRDRFVECPLPHPTWFLRRELLLRYGYREQGWPEDYDLLLRLLTGGHALGVVPRALLSWRDSPTRLSRTHPAYAQAAFVECKAHFLAQSWLGAAREFVLWGYGDTGRNLSRALRRRGFQPRQIVELHPGRLGQRIAGAEVIAPEALAGRADLPPIIVSVAGAGPRAEIRQKLTELGFGEGRDYVCAA